MEKLFLHSHLGFFNPLLMKEKAPSYPPHNIIHHKCDDDGNEAFEIEVAVAGYSRDELDVTVHKDMMKIASVKTEKGEPEHNYLHRGIAKRAFELSFQLGAHVKVDDVRMEDGVLRVYLIRDIPEEEKPRKFDIK